MIAADARLYLILTPSICFLDPLETARRALYGGAGMLQLRDKHSTDEEYLRLARPLAAICRRHGAPFILNDRVHLVEEADADGAHVGEDDMPPAEARVLLRRLPQLTRNPGAVQKRPPWTNTSGRSTGLPLTRKKCTRRKTTKTRQSKHDLTSQPHKPLPPLRTGTPPRYELLPPDR